MTDTVKLDILSDPICPWCYIGKTYLDAALTENPNHPFAIEWHPFQLNPEMPAGGMDRRAYLEGKFGGKEAAMKAYAPVVEHAKAAGLTINFEAMKRTPNTIDAHRLIHWAGIEGRQIAAVSSLFEAYSSKRAILAMPKCWRTLQTVSGLTLRLLANYCNQMLISRKFARAMPTAARWA